MKKELRSFRSSRSEGEVASVGGWAECEIFCSVGRCGTAEVTDRPLRRTEAKGTADGGIPRPAALLEAPLDPQRGFSAPTARPG